jgi:hypothetical protein
MPDRYHQSEYLIRRKVLKLFGATFYIYGPGDEQGELLFYTKMKAFKLKEDIRLYTGEDMTEELLTIKARNIWDISTTYDVVDATTGEPVGALQRRGAKSILRDTWNILDTDDNEIGSIQEDSMFLAVTRRLLNQVIELNLIPQSFEAEIGGRPAMTLKQNFNPFVQKLTLDIVDETGQLFDPRMAIAAGVLMLAIEGRQG